MLKLISELFGGTSAQHIEVGEKPPQFAAQPIAGYVFRTNLLRDMLIFWRLNKRACMLVGHKGTGKTSLPEQWHLKIQKNLKSMTGNGKTTLEALFGQYVLDGDGKLIWQDGPLTWAARNGGSVLINEFNAIPEDVQLSLIDVAHDGSPFVLPEKGEQFMPHPDFRIFCTMNPKGGNEFMYKARKDIDAALKERFFWIDVGYGSREDEEKILYGVFQEQCGLAPSESKLFVEQLVNVAEIVRQQAGATNASAIPEIISTRVLVNWAIYWRRYGSQQGSVHMALQRAMTFGCSPEVKYQIHKIVEQQTNKPSPYSLDSTST